ncbi:hypothetical protein BD408DRAFT_240072 [Parasitella parasitica]|nr:hypothetical protein BD408DRAFT_240072 [Parasitella parasitica]
MLKWPTFLLRALITKLQMSGLFCIFHCSIVSTKGWSKLHILLLYCACLFFPPTFFFPRATMELCRRPPYSKTKLRVFNPFINAAINQSINQSTAICARKKKKCEGRIEEKSL